MKKKYLLLLLIPLFFACSKEEDNDHWGLKRTIWKSVNVEDKPDGTSLEESFELLFSETSFRAKYLLILLKGSSEKAELQDSCLWIGKYWMDGDEVKLNYKIEVSDEDDDPEIMEPPRATDTLILDGETMEGVFDGYELRLTKSGVFEFD